MFQFAILIILFFLNASYDNRAGEAKICLGLAEDMILCQSWSLRFIREKNRCLQGTLKMKNARVIRYFETGLHVQDISRQGMFHRAFCTTVSFNSDNPFIILIKEFLFLRLRLSILKYLTYRFV